MIRVYPIADFFAAVNRMSSIFKLEPDLENLLKTN